MKDEDYEFEIEKRKTFANEYQKLSWKAFKETGNILFMRNFMEVERERENGFGRERE